MAVTALEIRDFGGPAFSAVAEADVQKWLDFALRRLDATTWGIDLDDGVTFLTLHYVQQFVLSNGAGGAAGALSAVKVGSVTVAYAGNGGSVDDASLGTTAWGRSYLDLLRGLGLGILSI